MSDNISLPQIIVSEAIAIDTVLVVPRVSSSQWYADQFGWQHMTRHKDSYASSESYRHAMNMVIDASCNVVTTDNHNGTYTHTYIPRDVISLKFTPNILPEQPIVSLYSGGRGRGINHARVGSTLDDWLKVEGIYHEAHQNALSRVLAWECQNSILDYPKDYGTVLHRILTRYKPISQVRLWEQSYGILSRLFGKVRGK